MAYPEVSFPNGATKALSPSCGTNSPSVIAAIRSRRLDVEFTSGKDLCRAWLYVPEGVAAPPVIVMAHGLGGTREMRLDAFAEHFCAAGYACLLFDYRHFGASGGMPRQLLDVKLQLEDWASAIGYARGLGQVDGSRVILWGTSFSGGHVLAAAARDGRIAAVISQNPFTDGISSVLAVNPLVSMRVMVRALRDLAASWLGTAPVMVPLAGKPGSTALMTSPDVWGGYLRMHPEGAPGVNHVSARIGFYIGFYRPGRHAAKLSCPTLFCICQDDSVAPAGAALRHSKRAPKAEIRITRAGHFDIYFDKEFERAVEAQCAFLRAQVPVRTGA